MKGSFVVTFFFFKYGSKKHGKETVNTFSPANFYSHDRFTGQIGESIARRVERYNDRIIYGGRLPRVFLRFERQRFSGGDGRPEFPPVVPVFDLAFRERSIRFSYESSSAHDL